MKLSLSSLLTTILVFPGIVACAAEATNPDDPADGTGVGGDGNGQPSGSGGTANPGGSGTGGTAGTPGTGGSPGTGGAGSTPATCAAIDPNDMLSDFEGEVAKLSEVGGRSGSWYLSDDGSGTSTPIKVEGTPLAAEAGGACDSGFAFHTTGSGFTGWGSLAAVDLVPKVSDIKQAYDASAYSGLAFRAKASGALQVRVEISTVDTMEEGGVCNPAAMTGDPDRCGDHLGLNVVLSGEWKDFQIPFAQMAQKGWGLPAAGLDASATYSVRFKVEGGDYDYTIDDVHLTK